MTGLVLWYPFNETSGDARDFSGEENDGSVGSGINRGAAGRFGIQCYDFPNNDIVTVPNGTIDPNKDFTMSYWIYHRGTVDNRVLRFENDLRYIHGISDRSNDADNMFGIWVDGTWRTDIISMPPDEWIHILATYNSESNVHTLYKNGNRFYSFVDSVSGSTSDTNRIGGENASSENYDGLMADFRVYQRVLSKSEINKLYEWDNVDTATPPDNTDGGVSYYSFDSSGATDEWNSNDGTVNGATYINDGGPRGNGAYSFDGTSDGIDFGNISGYGGDITISFWQRANSVPSSSHRYLVGDAPNNATNGFSFSFYNAESVYFYHDGKIADTTNGFGVRMENWVHFVGVIKQGNRMELWTNGVLNNTTSVGTTPTNSGNAFEIGSDGSSQYYDGVIDDVRIYDRALSNDEIQELYRYGTQGIDMRDRLVNKR